MMPWRSFSPGTTSPIFCVSSSGRRIISGRFAFANGSLQTILHRHDFDGEGSRGGSVDLEVVALPVALSAR